MITQVCDGCGKVLQIPDEFAGSHGQCNKCGAKLFVKVDHNESKILHPPLINPQKSSTTPKSKPQIELLHEYLVEVAIESRFHVMGKIPAKKESNARKSMEIGTEEQIIALIDTTAFGSGKDGIVLTDKNVYIKEMFESPISLSYKKLSETKMDIKGSKIVFSVAGAEFSILLTSSGIKVEKVVALLGIAAGAMLHKLQAVSGNNPNLTIASPSGNSTADVEVEAPKGYFVPSSPDSMLARFQKFGFFTKTKYVTIRDTALISIILFLPYLYVATKDASLISAMVALLAMSIAYIIYYMVSEGIIKRMIAIAMFMLICTFLSMIFPPLGILVIVFAFYLTIRKFISFLRILPWMLLSVPYYYFLYTVSEFSSSTSLLVEEGIFGLFFLEFCPAFTDNWWKYLIFCIILAMLTGIKDKLKTGLFFISILFGTVPILLILIYLLKDDFGDIDIIDGQFHVDSTGLRCDFPDGVYARWVESDVVAPHWRFYRIP